MASQNSIEIELKLKDADKSIESLKKFKDETKAVEKESESMASKLKKNWMAVAGAVAATGVALKKAFDFADSAAKFEEMGDILQSKFGVPAKEAMDTLSKSVQGTISKIDLMAGTTRAFSKGAVTDVDQVAKIWAVARAKSDELGVSATEAFNQIVDGVAKGSAKSLAGLGIMISGFDKTKDGMDLIVDTSKALDAVFSQNADSIASMGNEVLSSADKFDQFKAGAADLKLELGAALLPIFNSMIEIIKPVIGIFEELPKGVKGATAAILALTPAIAGLLLAFGPIPAAIGAILIGVTGLAAANTSAAKSVEELRAEYKKAKQTADEETKSQRERVAKIDRTIARLKEYFKTAEEGNATYQDNLMNLKRLEKEREDVVSAISAKESESLKIKAELDKAEAELASSIPKTTKEIKSQTAAVVDDTEAKRKAAEAARLLAEQQQQMRDDYDATTRAIGVFTGAAGQQISTIRNATAATKEQGLSATESFAANLTLVGAIINAVGEAGAQLAEFGASLKETGNTASGAFGRVLEQVGGVVSALRKGGFGLREYFMSLKETSDEAKQSINAMMADSSNAIQSAQWAQALKEVEDTYASLTATINETRDAAIEAAYTSSGLAELDRQDQEARIARLKEDLAEETDATKRADIERQLARIEAQEAYDAEVKEINEKAKVDQLAADQAAAAASTEIKRKQAEFDRALTMVNLMNAEAEAIAQAGKIVGRSKRNAEMEDIRATYKDLRAQLQAIPAFAEGGSFVTNGPQLIMVGDNPGGRERVDITPSGKGGPGATFTGPVTITANNPREFFEAINRYQRQNGVFT